MPCTVSQPRASSSVALALPTFSRFGVHCSLRHPCPLPRRVVRCLGRRNLVTALIEHDRIRTTLPKAKELKRVADQMVTMAKANTLESRRRAAGFVMTPAAVDKLFDVLGPRYACVPAAACTILVECRLAKVASRRCGCPCGVRSVRPGGYTRVIRAGYRPGDQSPMAVIEYVDRYDRAVASPLLSLCLVLLSRCSLDSVALR